MARREPPARPLVVVLGSTGTGKSELAVELALRYNGEVINADAMQLYRGLPIITNKISVPEQRGVPHHLLGHIELSEQAWTVAHFKREASRIAGEIRGRGRLPIVVGGTHYYTNGLLFTDTLVSGSEPQITEDFRCAPVEDAADAPSHPILDGPTEGMYLKLKEVDPVMAQKWHPNDRRKIRRSLEIFLTTGKKASDIYAEQRERRSGEKLTADGRDHTSPWQTLLFWIYSGRDALNERLNARVDKMVEAGLLDETGEMFDYLRQREVSQSPVDRTTGIWQSIGLKEFEPYLKARKGAGSEPQHLSKLHDAAVEDVKTATRRYAKYQQRWIKLKMLPLLTEEHALDHLYVLDSSDVDKWQQDVVDKAVGLTLQYLSGEERPSPEQLSETAKDVLSAAVETSERKATPCHKVCRKCNKTLVTEELWDMHLRSRHHRRASASAKRRALLPELGPETLGPEKAPHSDNIQEHDLASS